MTETETQELAEAPAGKPNQEDRLVVEGEIAGDYLEELLDLLDFDGDIDLDVEGDRAIVSIDGGDDLADLAAVIFELEAIQRVRVIRDLRDAQFGVEIGDEVGEIHAGQWR
jgi:spoIIIJ-associated protein